MATNLADLQRQVQPVKPADSLAATPLLGKDVGEADYALAAVLPDGTVARVPCSSLSWEEQTGEIATRITATLPDDEIGGTGKRLPDLIMLNTPVSVLAAMGDDPEYVEVARGLVEELAPNDGTGGTFEIIAYDPIKTLLNNKIDKFYEANITPKEVITRLFADQNIPLGDLSPHLEEKEFPGASIFHGQTIADVLTKTVENAMTLLDPSTNVRLVIRTDQGKISVVEVGSNKPIYWLLQSPESANVIKVTQRIAITDLVTQVVITGKAGEAGEAAVVTTYTADTAATFGTRTDMIALTTNVTPDQVKKQAQDDINQKGQPRNDRSIIVPDIPMVRKYDQIRVTAGTLDNWYSVESVQHDEASRTMTVGLGNLTTTPISGVFVNGLGQEIDESAIPPVQTTGGSSGDLVNIGTGPINDAQLYALAKAAGFTGQDAIMAVAISLAEDGSSDPQARNHNKPPYGDDLGLWQINAMHWADYGGEAQMIVPLSNAKAAYGIWSAAGGSWRPWSTYTAGAYAKYMDRANAAAQAPAAQVPTPNAAFTQSGASGTPNSALVTAMNKYVNSPYVLGGNTPAGIDCSGFTKNVFSTVGVNLPRTAQTQWNSTQRVTQPQFGDLVFFSGTYDCPDPITHVGIYVGNGQMVSAVEPHVKRDNLSDPYWKAHLAGFGRISS